MEINFSYKTKIEIAIHQLEKAIDLFILENDLICATTLAGAAEEIFGKIIKKKKEKSSLGEYISDCIDILKTAGHIEIKEQIFANERNALRNELKHLCSGNDVLIINTEAKDMIDRAIINMMKLNIQTTEKVRSFIEKFWI